MAADGNLLDDIDEPPVADEESSLWQRLRDTGDPEAREALLQLHLPYARVVAARMYSRRTTDEIEFDEFHQMATVALIESLDRYNPELGAKFRTYAHHRMSGAILSGLERLSERQQQISLQRRLRNDRLSLAVETPTPASSHADELFRYLADVGIGIALGAILDGSNIVMEEQSWLPDRSYERVELKQFAKRIRHLIRQLTEREAQVIQWHYLQSMPFEEIAAKLGISKPRVSQLHYQGLARLRKLLDDAEACNVRW